MLGPNGAGKTTTINMLSTLLRPTSGNATVAGFDVAADRDSVRKSIGLVFIDDVPALVELTDKAGTLAEKYSGGMERRLEIARGLTHRPKVLFLDEPTLGLDAQTRRHIWEYIKKLNREAGVTIILTTYYMEEADYLCGRIAIMDHGKFVAIDAPTRLKDTLGGDVVSLEFEGDAAAFLGDLDRHDWIKRSKFHKDILSLTMEKGERRIPELVMLAREKGVTINCVNLHKPSLEDVFLQFTGRTIREQEAIASERRRAMVMRQGRRRP